MWLVVIAAVNSVIGAYYYLRVIIVMYFSDPEGDYVPSAVAPALAFALVIAAERSTLVSSCPCSEIAKSAADSSSTRSHPPV